MSEVKDDSNAAKTLSAAARRSFFRRKHKHKRSGSKDGKDLLALDTFSNDSIPLFEGKWLTSLFWRALRIRFAKSQEPHGSDLTRYRLPLPRLEWRCCCLQSTIHRMSRPSSKSPHGHTCVCSSSHHVHVQAGGRGRAKTKCAQLFDHFTS